MCHGGVFDFVFCTRQYWKTSTANSLSKSIILIVIVRIYNEEYKKHKFFLPLRHLLFKSNPQTKKIVCKCLTCHVVPLMKYSHGGIFYCKNIIKNTYPQFFFFFKKYVTFIKEKRNSIYLELMRLYHVKIFLYPSYKINNILYILSQYIYWFVHLSPHWHICTILNSQLNSHSCVLFARN